MVPRSTFDRLPDDKRFTNSQDNGENIFVFNLSEDKAAPNGTGTSTDAFTRVLSTQEEQVAQPQPVTEGNPYIFYVPAYMPAQSMPSASYPQTSYPQDSAQSTGWYAQSSIQDSGTFMQNPAQDTGAYMQNPVQDTGAFMQNPTQDTGAFMQNPTQATGTYMQNPVQDTGAFMQNAAQNSGWNSQDTSQNTGWYGQGPSLDTGWYTPNPLQDTGSFMQSSAQNTGWQPQSPNQNTGAILSIAAQNTGEYRAATAGQKTGTYTKASEQNTVQSPLSSPDANSSDKTGVTGESRKKKRHIGLIVFLLLVVVFLALCGGIAFAGYNFYQSVERIQNEAAPLSTTANDFVEAVISGNTEKMQTTSNQIISSLSNIKSEVDTPLWELAEKLPAYGSDVKAARELVNFADNVVQGILVPTLPTLINYPRQSLYANGNINGPALQSYCDIFVQLGPAVAQAARKAGSLPHSDHFDQINTIVDQIQEPLNIASSLLNDNSALVRELPYILGCYGERHYLVVAMNNCEIKSLGGFAGAFIPVTVTNGHVSIGSVISRESFDEYGIYYDFSYAKEALFNDRLGNVAGDVTIIPDFPRACYVWNEMFAANFGITYDGIIALDPFVLQYIVGVFGDTQIPDGDILTGDNAARILLHDTYYYWPNNNNLQDEYFALAAGAVVNKIVSTGINNIDFSNLFEALMRAINEHRLIVWFADPGEEEICRTLGCSGELYNDVKTPVLGVYFNDDSWSKIDWWIHEETSIGEPWVNENGTATYPVTTILSNDMTWNDVYTAPEYMLAHYGYVNSRGDMSTIMYLFAPMGGYFTDLITSSGSMSLAYYGDHEVLWSLFRLGPGEQVVLTYNVTVPAEAEVPLTTHITPTAETARH